MKTIPPLLSLLCVLLLCGCFQIKDELSIEPDGSGTVRLEVETSVNPDEVGMTAGMFNRNMLDPAALVYPPLNQAEAALFFPSPGFAVVVKKEHATGQPEKVVIIARFKDIQTLLASRYAQEHQLSLERQGQTLLLRGKTGMEALARAAALPLEKEGRGMVPPALNEARRHTNAMRCEFRVNLPNIVGATTGQRDGKSVTWLFEHAKCPSTDAFAEQVASVLEAACPADGIQFTLPVHVRLGLLPFAQLQEGEAIAAAPVPPAETISNAMRFIPHTLQVSRSINLSGHEGSNPSSATLAGEFIIPTDLAPPRWGPVRLLEATDAKGNDLLPKDDDASLANRMWRSYGHRGLLPSQGDDDAADQSQEKPKEVKRPMQLSFRAPEWKVKEISRLKGSIALLYPRAGQVLKLTNAIPEKWIEDSPPDRPRIQRFDRGGEDQRQLRDTRLTEAGLSLQLVHARYQSGALYLQFMLDNQAANWLAAQVFDSAGKPCCTQLSIGETGPGRTIGLTVLGHPQAPLSLAFVMSPSSAEVEFPFELQHIPIDNN